MKYDGIIFDLDGTLWDSTAGVLVSWNHVLKEQPDCADRVLTAEELDSVMGLGAEDLTAKLFPTLPLERRLAIFNACAEYECEYLAEHGGDLYPGLTETLDMLSKDRPLFIVSNCPDGYIQAFLKAHDTGRYIQDFECIGRTGLPKAENIRLIVERNGLTAPVYVGDTQWDCNAATAAGVPFIFAAYGFGKVEDKPAIETFAELPALV